MYLEITRWRHVKPSLAFNPGPVQEGGVRPRAGLPLIMLYVVCAAAPLAVLADWVRQFTRKAEENSRISEQRLIQHSPLIPAVNPARPDRGQACRRSARNG
jgi:hypothetical protein